MHRPQDAINALQAALATASDGPGEDGQLDLVEIPTCRGEFTGLEEEDLLGGQGEAGCG